MNLQNYFFRILHQNKVQNIIQYHDNNIWKHMCIKIHVIVLRPIFDTRYKEKNWSKYTCELYITNCSYSNKVGTVSLCTREWDRRGYLALDHFYNVQLVYYWMIVTTSVCAPSWRNNVCACSLTVFVPYPLHTFRLMMSFSYWWLWHLSVLMSYHILSAYYVRVRPCSFCLFYFCIYTWLYSLFVWSDLNRISNSWVYD